MAITTEKLEAEEIVRSENKSMGWSFTLPADAVLAEEPERQEHDQASEVREGGIWADLDVRISLV